MPKFNVDINGSQYSVDAPNEESLPEIVETIANENKVSKEDANNSKIGNFVKVALTQGLMTASGGAQIKDVPGGEKGYQITKNSLPLIGQVIGGLRGGAPGAIAGTTIGVAGQQLLDKVVEDKNFDPISMTKDVAITTAIELATRGGASLLYKRARANDEILNGAGKALKQMKETLKNLSDVNPDVSVPIQELDNIISSPLKFIMNKSGAVGTLLRKWQTVLTTLKESGKENIPLRNIIEFEDNLNDSIKFAHEASTGEVKTQAKNRAMEEVGKIVRKGISDIVDREAVKNGFELFPTMSKAVAKAFKTVSKKPQNKLARLIEGGLLAQFIYVTTKNPTLTALATPALYGISEPAIQESLFKVLEKSGIGRIATLGLSEIGRKVSKS